MIRFIDLRHHEDDIQARFAFFCTVTDTFIAFGGEQTFDTVADFQEAAANSSSLDRCTRLCPDWAHEPDPRGCPVCEGMACPPWGCDR